MADSFLTRIAKSFSWRGPNLPEEDIDTAPETGKLISRANAGWGVPQAWLGFADHQDKILSEAGGVGLEGYEDLLDDDVAFSNFQQRRLAVIERDWEVLPGDEKDPRSVEAAEHLKGQLDAIGFDRICDKMLYGIWYGYAVAEGLFEVGPDGKYRLADIVVPDRSWFGFSVDGELRFRGDFGSFLGEAVPPNKFWVLRTGASHDFAFYGLGLAHWCYWPIWFKRNVIRFWAMFLEKLGYPTVLGETLSTMTADEKDNFLATLVAVGRDRAVRVPEGASEKIKLMESSRTANSGTYLEMVTEQNESLMRVILGQPGTSKATAQGIGSGQAEVHQDVKEEIVKADADLLCESFNATFPRWLTRWNFGEDVKPPRVYRKLDDEEDLTSIAERDKVLNEINIKRKPDTIEGVYGPDYEYVEPEPIDLGGGLDANGKPLPSPLVKPAANDDDGQRKDRRAEFAAQDVKPLYVYRELEKPADLLKWARSQGIPNIVAAADLHVTVLNSKTAVDWFDMSDGWGFDDSLKVGRGGARTVERLGEEGAIVLRFASEDLKWSHQRKIDRGASHDFPEYLPHVTVGFDPEGTLDLEAVEPFIGELQFGPEIFAAAKLRLPPGIKPIEFSAEEEDAIERLALLLADETNPLMLEFGAVLKDALAGTGSPEAARIALLEAFEKMPAERMAEITGLSFAAERMMAEAGIEP